MTLRDPGIIFRSMVILAQVRLRREIRSYERIMREGCRLVPAPVAPSSSLMPSPACERLIKHRTVRPCGVHTMHLLIPCPPSYKRSHASHPLLPAQGIACNAYFLAYLVSPRTCHAMVRAAPQDHACPPGRHLHAAEPQCFASAAAHARQISAGPRLDGATWPLSR